MVSGRGAAERWWAQRSWLPQWQGNVVLGGCGQCVGEDLREDVRVVVCVVGSGLGDIPVSGEGGQFVVVDGQGQLVGQFEGAHDGVSGQVHSGAEGFGSQECVVECGVVGDKDSAGEKFGERGCDVGEGGLVGQHGGGNAVDVGGPGVDTGIEQCAHGVFDSAVGAEGEGGDADDPVGLWAEA